MNVRYRVELSQAEREQLTEMLSGGKHGNGHKSFWLPMGG